MNDFFLAANILQKVFEVFWKTFLYFLRTFLRFLMQFLLIIYLQFAIFYFYLQSKKFLNFERKLVSKFKPLIWKSDLGRFASMTCCRVLSLGILYLLFNIYDFYLKKIYLIFLVNIIHHFILNQNKVKHKLKRKKNNNYSVSVTNFIFEFLFGCFITISFFIILSFLHN